MPHHNLVARSQLVRECRNVRSPLRLTVEDLGTRLASPATTFPKQASHRLHTETFVNLATQTSLLFERESELSSQVIQPKRPGTGQKE